VGTLLSCVSQISVAVVKYNVTYFDVHYVQSQVNIILHCIFLTGQKLFFSLNLKSYILHVAFLNMFVGLPIVN